MDTQRSNCFKTERRFIDLFRQKEIAVAVKRPYDSFFNPLTVISSNGLNTVFSGSGVILRIEPLRKGCCGVIGSCAKTGVIPVATATVLKEAAFRKFRLELNLFSMLNIYIYALY